MSEGYSIWTATNALRARAEIAAKDAEIARLKGVLTSARTAFNNLAGNACVSNPEAMSRACRMERDMIDAALAPESR